MKDKEYFNDIKKYKNALDYLSKADLKVPNEIWAKLELLISIRSAQQLNATRPLNTLYFSTFEKFRKHILIRTFAHSVSRNKTQEIMRMIPGCNRKLVRNFFCGYMSGYNVVWEKTKDQITVGINQIMAIGCNILMIFAKLLTTIYLPTYLKLKSYVININIVGLIADTI